MDEEFIKLCYAEFKKNDEKFPKEWTFEDYKKYTEECNILAILYSIEECNRILEKEK